MALVLAMSGVLLLMTLGGALVTLTTTETAIAAGVRDATQTLYAAESGVAAAIGLLETVPDWETVVSRGPAPFLSRRFDELLSDPAVDPRLSVLVWLTDDPIEDPATLVVRAQASGAHGAQRTVETTIWRSAEGVRVLDWRELR